ncbi:MAG TPA: 6-phosphogluconolactonase [Thermoleophilaceae bacterium]|nr:6-phosphogluconolactonase [Thermoleophilaceae bacterium]
MRAELRISDQLTEDAARLLAEAAVRGGHMVITGGSTPKAAYNRVAELGADWSGTEIWFTDERCVAPDHEHSNFRMANESLLSKIQPQRVHRMQGELGPEDGAQRYDEELAAVFGPGVVPRFDLILLGLGPDVHCASLFPNNPELGIKDHAVAGVDQPGMAPLVPRITLTLPVLNAGARVVFLVSGEEKAEAVARAFSGRPGPEAPSSLVQPGGEYVLLCDAAAAAHL